jgi:hypothetical protein
VADVQSEGLWPGRLEADSAALALDVHGDDDDDDDDDDDYGEQYAASDYSRRDEMRDIVIAWISKMERAVVRSESQPEPEERKLSIFPALDPLVRVSGS